MLAAEGQHFICPLNMGYIHYKRVILSFRGIFLPEKRVLQDMICCPSALNKFPFKRTYYSIFGKECFIIGYVICCPFRMKCLAPYTVPMGPTFCSQNSTFSGTFSASARKYIFLFKIFVVLVKDAPDDGRGGGKKNLQAAPAYIGGATFLSEQRGWVNRASKC